MLQLLFLALSLFSSVAASSTLSGFSCGELTAMASNGQGHQNVVIAELFRRIKDDKAKQSSRMEAAEALIPLVQGNPARRKPLEDLAVQWVDADAPPNISVRDGNEAYVLVFSTNESSPVGPEAILIRRKVGARILYLLMSHDRSLDLCPNYVEVVASALLNPATEKELFKSPEHPDQGLTQAGEELMDRMVSKLFAHPLDIKEKIFSRADLSTSGGGEWEKKRAQNETVL